MTARSPWLLALLAVAGGCTRPSEPAPPDAPAPSGCAADGVEVVAYNTLHGIRDEDPAAQPDDRFAERLALVAPALGELRPDVILLQEFLLPTEGSDRPDPGEAILDALGRTDYWRLFGNVFGEEPTTGASAGLGQGIISCLPLEQATNRTVGFARVVVHARLTGPDGPIDVYNAHIDGGDDGAPQIEETLALIEEVGAGGLEIVGGDLNSEDGEPAILALDGAGFIDLGEQSGLTCDEPGDIGCTGGALPLGEEGRRADERIDYLWQRGGDPSSSEARPLFDEPFDLEDGDVLWGSDHVGVAARVR